MWAEIAAAWRIGSGWWEGVARTNCPLYPRLIPSLRLLERAARAQGSGEGRVSGRGNAQHTREPHLFWM